MSKIEYSNAVMYKENTRELVCIMVGTMRDNVHLLSEAGRDPTVALWKLLLRHPLVHVEGSNRLLASCYQILLFYLRNKCIRTSP